MHVFGLPEYQERTHAGTGRTCKLSALITALHWPRVKYGVRKTTKRGTRATLWLKKRKYLNCDGGIDCLSQLAVLERWSFFQWLSLLHHTVSWVTNFFHYTLRRELRRARAAATLPVPSHFITLHKHQRDSENLSRHLPTVLILLFPVALHRVSV